MFLALRAVDAARSDGCASISPWMDYLLMVNLSISCVMKWSSSSFDEAFDGLSDMWLLFLPRNAPAFYVSSVCENYTAPRCVCEDLLTVSCTPMLPYVAAVLLDVCCSFLAGPEIFIALCVRTLLHHVNHYVDK